MPGIARADAAQRALRELAQRPDHRRDALARVDTAEAQQPPLPLPRPRWREPAGLDPRVGDGRGPDLDSGGGRAFAQVVARKQPARGRAELEAGGHAGEPADQPRAPRPAPPEKKSSTSTAPRSRPRRRAVRPSARSRSTRDIEAGGAPRAGPHRRIPRSTRPLGARAWASADLYYRQRLAPAFLQPLQRRAQGPAGERAPIGRIPRSTRPLAATSAAAANGRKPATSPTRGSCSSGSMVSTRSPSGASRAARTATSPGGRSQPGPGRCSPRGRSFTTRSTMSARSASSALPPAGPRRWPPTPATGAAP